MCSFSVLTMYTSVTPTSNIYYNASLLRNNNGSSQLDLFICLNYRGSSFYELVCSLCCPFACFVFVNFTILLNFGFALSLCKRTFFECYWFLFFFWFVIFSYRLLQCCALAIRMCTICITRFLICVYSLASQRLTITF